MFGPRQYYGLVAGLRELTPGGVDVSRFDTAAVYAEIRRELSRGDRRDAGLVMSLADIYGLRRERIEQLYALCAASRSRFLREWAEFDRSLRNAIAIHTARSNRRDAAESTLGEVEAEKQNYSDALSAALEKSNLMEKERAIDSIRQQKADELSETDTFGAPTILAYLVKMRIIERWVALDPEIGREMYDRLVNSMDTKL